MVRTTARLIADVKPETKEKLKASAEKQGKSMTSVLEELIEKEYKRLLKK